MQSIGSTLPPALQTSPDVQEFDPTALYARLMHFYPGLSDERIDKMDYMRMFGLLRERQRMIEEENNQHDRQMAANRAGQQEVDPQALQQMLNAENG